MKQDEEVICTISKDSNHISNQYLTTHKKKIATVKWKKANDS